MQTQIFSDSYEKQIAFLLKNGERLTVASVSQKVKTSELRHFIAQLKKRGMDIKSNWMTAPNGKRFKQYFLNQQTN